MSLFNNKTLRNASVTSLLFAGMAAGITGCKKDDEIVDPMSVEKKSVAVMHSMRVTALNFQPLTEAGHVAFFTFANYQTNTTDLFLWSHNYMDKMHSGEFNKADHPRYQVKLNNMDNSKTEIERYVAPYLTLDNLVETELTFLPKNILADGQVPQLSDTTWCVHTKTKIDDKDNPPEVLYTFLAAKKDVESYFKDGSIHVFYQMPDAVTETAENMQRKINQPSYYRP